MEKPNDIKRDSISVNYFLNTAAYSGLFSLLGLSLFGVGEWVGGVVVLVG